MSAPDNSKPAIGFSNIFQMRFGDNDVLLEFGVDMNPEQPGQLVELNARVAMTPRSAKILAYTLTKTIESFEQRVGPISLPPGKTEAIDKSLEGPFHTAKD